MPFLWSNPGFLSFAAPAIPSGSALAWGLARIAVAGVLFSAAFAAIALYLFRRSTRDLTLVYFGVFVALFAVRLLATGPTEALTRAPFDAPRTFSVYIDWLVTCTILVPLSLFLYQVLGEARTLFRWLIAGQAAFAVFGILAAAMGGNLVKLHVANNFVVLGTLVASGLFAVMHKGSLGASLRWSREVRVFFVGLIVWLLLVVHANLLGLRVLKGQPNVESLGFLVFVASLGYISARRVFANEERLLSINKELEIARQIQGSILPQRIPTLKGLGIAARYLPMSAVAGDFYDFLAADEKRVGILIADVTGHGVPAALIASMLKVAFAGQLAVAHEPSRVLTGLNQAVCGKFEEHFITAAYLFVDLENGLLRFSAAGHPPLLWTSGNPRRVREIQENGLMLGMFPEAAYTSVEIPVGVGDQCLLYTDGICEAKNSALEEFGKERLSKFLEGHRDATADRLADDLLAEIARWSGDSQDSRRAQDDDITLIALQFGARP